MNNGETATRVLTLRASLLTVKFRQLHRKPHHDCRS